MTVALPTKQETFKPMTGTPWIDQQLTASNQSLASIG
jgi:hypothetical protein